MGCCCMVTIRDLNRQPPRKTSSYTLQCVMLQLQSSLFSSILQWILYKLHIFIYISIYTNMRVITYTVSSKCSWKCIHTWIWYFLHQDKFTASSYCWWAFWTDLILDEFFKRHLHTTYSFICWDHSKTMFQLNSCLVLTLRLKPKASLSIILLGVTQSSKVFQTLVYINIVHVVY